MLPAERGGTSTTWRRNGLLSPATTATSARKGCAPSPGTCHARRSGRRRAGHSHHRSSHGSCHGWSPTLRWVTQPLRLPRVSSPGGSGAPEKDTPWKLIIFGAIAVYAILIVLFNRKQVDVS